LNIELGGLISPAGRSFVAAGIRATIPRLSIPYPRGYTQYSAPSPILNYIYTKQAGFGADWMTLSQDRDRTQAFFVHGKVHSVSVKCVEFLHWLIDCWIIKEEMID
jgi:hypothetical protein